MRGNPKSEIRNPNQIRNSKPETSDWPPVPNSPSLRPKSGPAPQIAGSAGRPGNSDSGLLLALALAGWLTAAPPLPAAVSITQLNSAQRWALVEFRLGGVPAATNNFDPDLIRMDATFTGPSGSNAVVPAFWYQTYSRSLSGGSESLTAVGSPEWRVRFTPTESGAHTLSVTVLTNGQSTGPPATLTFTAAPATPGARGFARVSPNGRCFVTDDGAPLPLIGLNVCWHHSGGTYDYDAWFGALGAAGGNFTRLWMCPWAFGLEAASNSLTRYTLKPAWQLDYVFALAEQKGIYLDLCLDYHGMFETEPDYWGGNNLWPQNPYNVANGGPCVNQNAFFTNATARAMYQKRLRYLVGRYGYSTRLLNWEFFNEINNVYAHLVRADVAAWHAEMGAWLRAHDPWRHPVTTSTDDHADLWNAPQMDFTAFHSYGLSAPAGGLASRAQSYASRYNKPVLIEEFGMNWQGWNAADDPGLRGLRQALWSGMLGGSAGTAMSWWWEDLHALNAYPLFTAVSQFTARTRWGMGAWTPVAFQQPPAPPTNVGALLPDGQPFTVRLALNTQWGPILPGALAVPNPEAAAESAGVFNSFVHGTAHPDLRIPFLLHAWWATNARVVLHLNSVSSGAILSVRSDGAEIHRQVLTNLDGGWQVNNEYNIDIPVAVPAGRRQIEIRNAGSDWFYLDWVRLENVLPSEYAGSWQPQPLAVGVQGDEETLFYAINPRLKYPGQVTNAVVEPVRGGTLTLSNWPAGTFRAFWHDAATAAEMGASTAVTSNGLLTLRLPDCREDVAARLVRLDAPLLVSAGAVWRYHDTGADLGAAWRAPDYDDRAWASGPAQLGFGDGDEATVINSNRLRVTTYFRGAFMVSNATAFGPLTLRLLRDDGAVVYLNGAEVFRSNLPTGAVTWATFATNAVSGSEENTFLLATLSPAGLREGTNVLAVEVHQSGTNSSDLSFDLELSGTVNAPPTVTLAAPSDGAALATDALPLRAAASGTDDLITRVEFFANGQKLGETNVWPFDWLWLEVPPGEHVLTARATDEGGRSAESPPVRVSVGAPPLALVRAGAVWKYHDTGANLGAAWRAPDYDDSAWPEGPAQLGFGDGDEATGVNTNRARVTTYFRRAFTAPAATNFAGALVRLLRDDGAVVHLNGAEVFRSNMPTGAITYLTFAATSASSGDETTNFHERAVSPALLVAGTNVLAVEVHQNGTNSSDLSFDLELLAFPPAALPPLAIARTNNFIHLRWPAWATGWTLRSAPNVGTGIAWTAVTNVSTAAGGWQSVTLPVGAGRRFYQLARP
jgi:hypothetical protein